MVGMRSAACPYVTSWQLAPPSCEGGVVGGGEREEASHIPPFVCTGMSVFGDIPIAAAQVSQPIPIT